MGKASGFEELEAWKSAREFRRAISKVAKKFPPHEVNKLTDQITRSSRSVSANISEGYGRYHFKENSHHCRIARGSLTETLDHLIVALDEGYIDDAELSRLRPQYDRCLKLINGYLNYLKGGPDSQRSIGE
jgi:four helix bundle protein